MNPKTFVTTALFGFACAPLRAQPAYPPRIEGARVEVYKTIGDVKLNMYIFTPSDHQATQQRPAIVFFFGGGWVSGTPKQFEQHCKYLASRGMVAMTADYRVRSRHQTTAKECVADAKSAVRWIRKHAKRLGIDPERIVASGGSAGGHIACCTGTIASCDEPDEDQTVSSMPNAMALFNPAVILAPVSGEAEVPGDTVQRLRSRFGVDPQQLSPFHHVRAGVPPAIIFHGKADQTVKYKTVELFSQAMQKAGNRCELHGYEDMPHAFFNYGRSENKYFIATVMELDKFLASLGYLAGEPTVGEWK